MLRLRGERGPKPHTRLGQLCADIRVTRGTGHRSSGTGVIGGREEPLCSQPLWGRTHRTREVEDFVIRMISLEILGFVYVFSRSFWKAPLKGQEQQVWCVMRTTTSSQPVGTDGCLYLVGRTHRDLSGERANVYILAAWEHSTEEPVLP